MRKTKDVQPCTALLRDGSRCGRYAAKGEVFCSVHKPGFVPKGAAVARPRPMSYEDRLREFANSKNPKVALQAISILERGKRDEDPTTSPEANADAFIRVLNDDERATLASLIEQFKSLREAVWARRPDLRPVWETEQS